ncbi:hypothetical protein MLD38_033459 [Melastoma candidum]|uniref:Uncharacterized protein n=1 Tax=Melastoma candidum TaxID=119954 RepID=A0ACB9M851_9MYRT|nr:hypothetical protein MLD38_033459 [Melastoma candidum]
MAGSKKKKPNVNTNIGGKKKEVKKETELGLSIKKDENFGDWYQEVVVNGEMIEYYDISGCYILRTWAMAIWEIMQEFFDAEIKKKTENKKLLFSSFCVSLCPPEREGPHRRLCTWGVASFFGRKATLHLKLKKRRIHEEYLAIPVIKGKKSEMEKFAGGFYTTSVEAFVPNTGRGVQGATSYCLGQNFAKMFEIYLKNEKGEKSMIGVMVMVHGDDKGLVLQPKLASVQVVVIPVPYKDADTQGIFDACNATVKTLCEARICAEVDLRDNYTAGWKYSHWELKGVPLRIEIGPKDFANNKVRAVRRDNSAKCGIPQASLVEQVKGLLDDIQKSLFNSAKEKRDACVQVVKTWDEFVEALGQKKLILAPWCNEEDVEKDVKARTKGETGATKTLCCLFDQPELPEGTQYFASGKPAKLWSNWGRSY